MTTKAKKTIDEIYMMRGIACLCIVMLHAITRVANLNGIAIDNHAITEPLMNILLNGRLLLTFGTAMFIFISEFLLAYTYGREIPEGFMKKRVRFILMPYLSMSVLYAGLMAFENAPIGQLSFFEAFMQSFAWNLVSGFYNHGYFIIVIFQFYFLHIVFRKLLHISRPLHVLPVTLLVSMLYLGVFNFIEPNGIPYGEEIWQGMTWALFPAWIFYFTLGYYCGKNYDKLKSMLEKRNWLIPLAPIFTGSLVLYMFNSGILTINSSKRFDMILFATAMMFLIWHIAIRIPKVPEIIKFISRYSFGIYLLHMFYLAILYEWMARHPWMDVHPVMTLVIFFGSSVIASIGSTYLISELPGGIYVIGKLDKAYTYNGLFMSIVPPQQVQ